MLVPPRPRRLPRAARGSMLIVAMGVLTLLSIMAATFVVLMRLEKNAATNFVDGVKAKMAAEAGLERIVADMRRIAGEPAFTNAGVLKPFIFGADFARAPVGKSIDVSKRVEEVDKTVVQDAYFWGKIGASYKGGVDEYRVKVVDTSALFDLNFPIEEEITPAGQKKPKKGQVLELMLEELGRQIRKDQAAKNREAWDPVNGPQDPRSRRTPIAYGGYTGPMAILAFRLTLDGKRFSSKSQLQEIMEEASYALLAEYVTAHGAYDEISVEPSTAPSVGGHSRVKRTRDQTRALINVNLAARPVLVAGLAPLAGRRHVYRVIRSQAPKPIESINAASLANYNTGGRPAGFDLQEDLDFQLREGWLYVGPFANPNDTTTPSPAEKIADWIIANRPFRGYGDIQARILATVEKLHTGMALDTTDLQPSALPPARMISNGAGNIEPGVRIFPKSLEPRFDLSAIEGEPYFETLVRDAGYSILLANFNRGFSQNSAVPNSATWLPVDKGNLLLPNDTDTKAGNDGNCYPRQTFELCYDTQGIFEITSLGQIRRQYNELVAQEKMLTVVKLLGTTSHRSQYDFERNDQKFSGGRAYFASFPNPRRLFTAPGSPLDDPNDPSNGGGSLASVDWGHFEIAPRSIFEDDPTPAGAAQAFGDLYPVRFGNLWTFAALFEGSQKGLARYQRKAMNAFRADSDFTLQPTKQWTHVFARAHGLKPDYAFDDWGGVVGSPRTKTDWSVSTGSGTLYGDGIHASYWYDRDTELWYRAGAGGNRTNSDPENGGRVTADDEQGALPLEPGEAPANYRSAPQGGPGGTEFLKSHVAGNVHYRKGGLEFWYKPEFDWSYPDASGTLKALPLFCGYAFASRVYYNHGNPQQTYAANALSGEGAIIKDPSVPTDPRGTPTDGTQLFLFRNTEGELRATRLFFRIVGAKWPDSKTQPSSDPPDPVTGLGDLPNRFIDPDEGDEYGNQTDPLYPGAKSFIYQLLGPKPPDNNPPLESAVAVFRRANERRPMELQNADKTKPVGYPWPPLEFSQTYTESGEPTVAPFYKSTEQEIQNARVDAYVKFEHMAGWKAGEWHHIAVYWNDTVPAPAGGAGDANLQIFVDGRKQSIAKVVGDAHSFCRVNEPPRFREKSADRVTVLTDGKRYPRDELQIGSIRRRIAHSGEGVFKHPNTFEPQEKNVLPPDPAKPEAKLITLFACGVIDDFVVYDGGTAPSSANLAPPPKRFMPEATLEQEFDLTSRMPGGGRPLELARLSWNILLPGDRRPPKGVAVPVPVKAGWNFAEVGVTNPPGVKQIPVGATVGSDGVKVEMQGMAPRAPGSRQYAYCRLEDGTGKPALLWPAAGGAPTTLRYKVKLVPASYDASLGSELSQVDTPACEEVSLTYFLPFEQTLLKERVVD